MATAASFVVRDQLVVHAPIERCFALSTHLAVVQITLKMRPIAGRLAGAVAAGDTIRWRGWKWGLRHTHESVIDQFDPPVFFRDRMVAGRFAWFTHDHTFTQQPDAGVLLRDEIRFSMQWGSAGLLFGRSIVLPHVRRLLRERLTLIKGLCEGEGWSRYLAAS